MPKGLFTLDEETNEVKFAEEFAFPKTDELRAIGAWMNVHQIILQAGRTTHVAPNLPEEELAAAMEELETKDPTIPRFEKGIDEHTQFPGEQPVWLSKVVGDTQLYAEGGEGENVSYAVNVIKSLRWPGAITVAKGGKCTSIYVGYGLKKGDPSYNPIEPPAVQEDPDEEAMHAQEIRRMLAAFDGVLSERHRYVLTRRYGLEDNQFRTLSQVGKGMSLSRERVRQIEREALTRLREHANIRDQVA